MHPRPPANPNLVGASRAELQALLADLDPRPYRVEQLHRWVNRRLAGGLEEMTDLPKSLREALATRCEVRDPRTTDLRRAPDGTAKYALVCADDTLVEAVVMPMNGRTTLCLSSQAGCAVGCVFCVTGVLGPDATSRQPRSSVSTA